MASTKSSGWEWADECKPASLGRKVIWNQYNDRNNPNRRHNSCNGRNPAGRGLVGQAGTKSMSVQVPLGRSNENAADRIMRSLDNRITGEPKPSRKQVGMVLHALADHTAIMSALKHRHDPTSPWPEATSMGRWFHDVGDMLEDRFGGRE
jgi:hypothetical protein